MSFEDLGPIIIYVFVKDLLQACFISYINTIIPLKILNDIVSKLMVYL